MTVDIANKLMQMRKQHGLSQEELADQLGVSRQSVGKWERAESSPDTDNLILLAQLYGVSLDNLLGTQPSNNSSEKTDDHHPHEKGSGISFSYQIAGKDTNNKQSSSYGIIGSLAVVIYLVLGVFGFWHPAWIIFVAVPVAEFVVKAISNRYSVARFLVNFPFAVLVTAVYLCIGCIWWGWGTWWVLFLFIPLYHTITMILFRKKAVIKYRRYDKEGNAISSYDGSPDNSSQQDIDSVAEDNLD